MTTFHDLSQAISSYTARACEKARAEKIKAQSIVVYIRTGIFNKENYYSRSEAMQLLHPSNDTIYITHVVQQLLRKIYKHAVEYKKAGIILCDLIPEKLMQHDLFSENTSDNEAMMKMIDRINHRFGSHHIFLATEGIKPNWITKSTKKSACYTTNWKELKTVIANNTSCHFCNKIN